MKEITTLVLPVAGLGTRTKPLAPRVPKCLIPLCGKPMVEYMLEDAIFVGIRRVILVVSPENRQNFERYVIKRAHRTFPTLSFSIVEQKLPLGDGHAVLQAAKVIGMVPFIVRFPDDLLFGKPHPLQQMIAVYKKYGASVLLVKKIPQKDIVRYGIIGGKQVAGFDFPVYRMSEIVEKPAIKDAPSNMMVIGVYVVLPDVLRDLRQMAKRMLKTKDALRLAHVFGFQIKKGKKVFATQLTGKRLDCGSIEGFREAEKFITKRK